MDNPNIISTIPDDKTTKSIKISLSGNHLGTWAKNSCLWKVRCPIPAVVIKKPKKASNIQNNTENPDPTSEQRNKNNVIPDEINVSDYGTEKRYTVSIRKPEDPSIPKEKVKKKIGCAKPYPRFVGHF